MPLEPQRSASFVIFIGFANLYSSIDYRLSYERECSAF